MPIGNEGSHVLDGLTVRGGLAVVDNAGNLASMDFNRFGISARTAVLMKGQGYFAETFPRNCVASGSAGTSGTIYFVAVGLLTGDVVSAMSVDCGTVHNGGTLTKLGLYSKGGTLLASSADGTSSFASQGTKTLAMTTPYTVTSDDLYFAAWIGTASTAIPAIRRNGGALPATAGVGSGTGCLAIQTGQTDLVASATLTFSNTNCLPMWIAIS